MNEERIMDILQENYFSSFFKYKNGLLHCEDKNVRDIHAWLKQRNVSPNSPVFVYSKNKLIHNVEGYMKALNETGRKFQLNYSLKANMNPHILSVMRDLGCSVTLVSGMELQLAMKVGFQPNFLVLNGNGKQIWEIELAVLHGCLLNIDSHFNLRQTIKACEKLKRKARVLLRINPDIDVVSSSILCVFRESDILSGAVTFTKLFCLPSGKGSIPKGKKICIHGEHFFPF